MQPKGIQLLTDEKLRCAAMPLGGIGTGSIALGGDGLLKQWQIMNIVKHDAFVPNSFFSIWMRKKGGVKEESISKALICPKVHEDPNFQPARSVSDHKISSGAKKMLEILPGVEKIYYNGEYPLAFLDFKDPSLPLDISLFAFNPFIPLDPKNSGLPVIIFQFTILNRAKVPVEFTLAGHFLNFLGWDGIKILKGTENDLYGGNVNSPKIIGEWPSIYMKSKILLRNDRRYGDLTLAIDDPDAFSSKWADLKIFWTHFSQNGTFPPSPKVELSPIGKTWTGSLGSRKIIEPGESKTIKFIFAWNFPNRVVDWRLDTNQIPDQETEFWIGNYYNNWFRNSIEVIEYVQENWDYLKDKTSAFHESFYSSTLPPEVLMSLAGPMSTIRTPSCFWIKAGSFHGFEGCHGASTSSSKGGCCPLDCLHVWNYVFSLAHLFPSLERTMRETEVKIQHESGYLPHRVVLPLYLPQLLKEGSWDMVGPAIDGMLGSVLKIYRDFLITGDKEFLRKMWPFIEKLMTYIFNTHDKELKGIMEGEQPNTYDCILHGFNTFIGTLYLTALLACEQIAKELGISEWVEQCRKVQESGRKLLDEKCWNGEYYIQIYNTDKVKQHQYGKGCHSDQLFGQWWAFQLGFEHILPPEHVNKALQAIVKYNFKKSLKGITQAPRIFASPDDAGLMVCTWPHGDRPSVPTLYVDEVWTGLEYEVASLCIHEDYIQEALEILQAVRARYDGSHRNPWNEVECGDHYVRAMSSWTLLPALTGVNYLIKQKQFQLGPKLNQKTFSTFFITGTAWGHVKQQVKNDKIKIELVVSHGNLELSSLYLREIKESLHVTYKIFLKERTEENLNPIEGEISTRDSNIEITFQKVVKISEGDHLFIEINLLIE
ncbi:MAG: GH116 family glycosyl-hydrolase [Promethearchaeota archaeon]